MMSAGKTKMFRTTKDSLNLHSYMIIATLMMLVTLGLTEVFKDNAILQKDLFFNYGCQVTKKLQLS
ncbi:MAG TPA: hypothetical protein DCF68_07385 [Cyanothece sp. UBA12306]|nr:hypothetical protein [Cyanothece sp. UBA12306]